MGKWKAEPLDPQYGRVYDAEFEALPPDPLESLEECQEFLNSIIEAPWFVKRYGKHKMEAGDGRGQPSARHSETKGMELPRETRRKDVVFHEVIHRLCPLGIEEHGAFFTGVELYLCQRVFGQEIARRLRARFKAHGVVWDRRLARCGRFAWYKPHG